MERCEPQIEGFQLHGIKLLINECQRLSRKFVIVVHADTYEPAYVTLHGDRERPVESPCNWRIPMEVGGRCPRSTAGYYTLASKGIAPVMSTLAADHNISLKRTIDIAALSRRPINVLDLNRRAMNCRLLGEALCLWRSVQWKACPRSRRERYWFRVDLPRPLNTWG